MHDTLQSTKAERKPESDKDICTPWFLCVKMVNKILFQPNLIQFTQSPNVVIETTSYYVQQMFASNLGDIVKEVTSDSGFGPIYWVASSAGDSFYFVKRANYGSDTQNLSVIIDGMTL
ncbi:alpha-N-arabinofuranosidase A precursor [Penicillium sp. IBT 16267x]|nr:alpha-N-arabinofuranosidase A precursor [Penicillium sp. IBT 16267x]